MTHAIKTGRIDDALVIRNGKELVDLDKANELWERNTLQQPPPTNREQRPIATRPTDQELRSFIQGLPEDQIPDLNDSRARREHYLAEKARLDALQGRKELLPADQVKAEAFNLARGLRDGLMRVADRVAPTLAATADARQVHHLLTEEIRVALRSLGDA